MVLWVVSAAALVVALLAWRQARRTADRLELLSQLYWDLRYQSLSAPRGGAGAVSPPGAGEPMDPSQGPGLAGPPAAVPRATAPGQGFIPLVSLKR
jgi:hypothetical protein